MTGIVLDDFKDIQNWRGDGVNVKIVDETGAVQATLQLNSFKELKRKASTTLLGYRAIRIDSVGNKIEVYVVKE